MKKQIVFLLAGLVSAGISIAQTTETKPVETPSAKVAKPLKLGYTNVNYILSISPESKVISSQLESTQKQYMKTIDDKKKDLQAKQEAYQKNAQTMLESIRKDKEEEMQNLYNSILSLQESASEDLKKKESDLVKPELDKIYKAINDVAAAEGFSHIFNSDQVLLYADENTDVTSLVLKKLGYKEPSESEKEGALKQTGGAGSPTTPNPSTIKPSGASPTPAKKPAGKK